jgi:hypothetical protein
LISSGGDNLALEDNKLPGLSFLHKNQPDRPIMTAAQFKAAVDSQAEELRGKLNSLIDELINSGVEKIKGVKITVDSTPPSNPQTKEIWIDTVNLMIKMWNGSAWITIVGGGGSGGTAFAIKNKSFIATTGQTLFSISDVGSYEIGKNFLSITVGNVPQNGNIVETSTTSFTIPGGVDAGVEVYAEWFQGVLTASDALTLREDIDTLDSNLTAHKVDYAKFLNSRLGMSAQAIINGNFDVWNRVPSGFITNPSLGTFVADRWLISGAPDGGVFPNLTHVRMPIDPITPQGSFYGYRFIAAPGGSGFGVNAGYGIYQRIEHGTRFLCGAGKKLTISFYASSSVVGKKLGVNFSQRYGTGGTPSANEQIIGQIITLSTTVTKYTITINTNTLSGKTFGTNNDDYFQIGFHYMWGSNEGLLRFNSATTELFQGAEVYLFQVQVCAGDVALSFQPRSFAEELALCQRYYEKSYDYSVAPVTLANTGAVTGNSPSAVPASTAGSINNPIYDQFKTIKRTIPTVTLYSTDGAINSVRRGSANRTGASAFNPDIRRPARSISFDNTSTTAIIAGDQIEYQWTADAEL